MDLITSPDAPFSLNTLPYGVFRPAPAAAARVGVAVGQWVLDLAALEAAGVFDDPALRGRSVFAHPALNAFMALGRAAWDETRATLQRLLAERPLSPIVARSLWPLAAVQMQLPAHIGDYTDFYSSREHATNVGAMFRPADEALLPNWLHLPVAYHGRSSSIIVSGDDVRRPWGQTLPPGAAMPIFQPSGELDFELEVGFFVGPGNQPGEPIPIAAAADHIFGLVLVNDWSARDIQRWEYRPLGPFLGKNFATSISPWVVPLAALAPFRCPGPPQEPPPLPYLQHDAAWAYDIELTATLQSAAMQAAGLPPLALSRTNFRHLYWSMAQQLAHHTANGCALRPGDLLASGTISGPTPDSRGSLLELAWGGTRPIALPTGETRRFLEDGDRLTIAGHCGAGDDRIDFGDVTGSVQPAHA
ncbi:Fumarylacetoacetate (FAA) hydrolase [Candidatus Promineifilum breve]|uniref:fumarylacetoacetase n=1 Tax=Candidatus Promineifilum breve TaxID=1806508 RepID=A0A160T068_9CHLR|nr:fumarylacetoacetase [Candidatus Promineifilum breve]CUS03126.2 Fumarylacetoacetate (FAA) hydrolase [Candidatus Promineifilum breve]